MEAPSIWPSIVKSQRSIASLMLLPFARMTLIPAIGHPLGRDEAVVLGPAELRALNQSVFNHGLRWHDRIGAGDLAVPIHPWQGGGPAVPVGRLVSKPSG
jgi:hypothetical protein